MEVVARENYKRRAPDRAGIFACAIARAKKVAVSQSREIKWVAYLGQMRNIGCDHTGKL